MKCVGVNTDNRDDLALDASLSTIALCNCDDHLFFATRIYYTYVND